MNAMVEEIEEIEEIEDTYVYKNEIDVNTIEGCQNFLKRIMPSAVNIIEKINHPSASLYITAGVYFDKLGKSSFSIDDFKHSIKKSLDICQDWEEGEDYSAFINALKNAIQDTDYTFTAVCEEITIADIDGGVDNRPHKTYAPAPKNNKSRGKLGMAMDIFGQNMDADRKDVINMFIEKAGIKPTNAVTYYYICKYRFGV